MVQLFLSHSEQIKDNLIIPFSLELSLIGLSYWFDRDMIISGDHIYDCIIKGIEESSHCIAFIDRTYLQKEWTMKELLLFREKEKKAGKNLIFPVYCEISKEEVYKIIPWLKDRAFERVEKENRYLSGECQKIVCRVLNGLLYEFGAKADVSSIKMINSTNDIEPFVELIHLMYQQKYYLSADKKLSCIELINILETLNLIFHTLHIPINDFAKCLLNLSRRIKLIVFLNPEYLTYDFIVVLKRAIDYIVKVLLTYC